MVEAAKKIVMSNELVLILNWFRPKENPFKGSVAFILPGEEDKGAAISNASKWWERLESIVGERWRVNVTGVRIVHHLVIRKRQATAENLMRHMPPWQSIKGDLRNCDSSRLPSSGDVRFYMCWAVIFATLKRDHEDDLLHWAISQPFEQPLRMVKAVCKHIRAKVKLRHVQLCERRTANNLLHNSVKEAYEALSVWLKETMIAQKSFWDLFRITTFGEGRAGKSSLLRSLSNQRYQRRSKSTKFGEVFSFQVRTECVKEADTRVLLSKDQSKRSEFERAILKNDEMKTSEPPAKQQRHDLILNVDEPSATQQNATSSTMFRKTASPDPPGALARNEGKESSARIESDVIEFISTVATRSAKNKREKDIRMIIHDFGGQDVFYSAHSMFLGDVAGIYLVVFSMEDWLTSKSKPKRFLGHWLHSICRLAEGSPFAIVGTHLDKLSNDRKKSVLEDINRGVEELLHKAQLDTAKDGLIRPPSGCFFPVDNTRSGAYLTSKCKGVGALSKALRDTIQMLSSTTRVPIAWIRIYDELRTIRSNLSSPVVSVSDIKEVCRKHGISSDTSVKAMLRRFHGLGAVIYFDLDRDGINQRVILDPHWFIQCLRRILHQKELHGIPTPTGTFDSHDESKAYRDLENGFLDVRILKYVWGVGNKESTLIEDEGQERFVLALLNEYGLISPFSPVVNDQDNEGKSCPKPRLHSKYIVPSMLRVGSVETAGWQSQKLGEKGIILDFEHFLPQAFYEILVCRVLSILSRRPHFDMRRDGRVDRSTATLVYFDRGSATNFSIFGPGPLSSERKDSVPERLQFRIRVGIQNPTKEGCRSILALISEQAAKITHWPLGNLKYSINVWDCKLDALVSLQDLETAASKRDSKVSAKEGGERLVAVEALLPVWMDHSKFLETSIQSQFPSVNRDCNRTLTLYNDNFGRKIVVNVSRNYVEWVLTDLRLSGDKEASEFVSSLSYKLSFETVFHFMRRKCIRSIMFFSHMSPELWRDRFKLEVLENSLQKQFLQLRPIKEEHYSESMKWEYKFFCDLRIGVDGKASIPIYTLPVADKKNLERFCDPREELMWTSGRS